MKNRPVQALLALFAIACACTSANPDSDAGSTSTRSETTDGGSETADPLNPWCCWCDEGGETRCVDWNGVEECHAFGTELGVAAAMFECSGVPILGTLDCPGLICDGGTTETGEPPLDIPFADPIFACCTCDLPPYCEPWDANASTCETTGSKWCELDSSGTASACFAQCG